MSSAFPEVGATAPDFTIDTTSGDKFSLSGQRGKKNVLLAFFPLAFTSVCEAEMCAFSEDYSAFDGKDVVVLPISVDSIPTLKEFKAKKSMKIDLGSDFKREVSRSYGTLIENTFFSNRAYVLIDKSGVVRWSFAEAIPTTRRENSEILAEIDKL